MSRVYSAHMLDVHITTDDSGDGFPVSPALGMVVVWKCLSFDLQAGSLTGEQLWIQYAGFVIARSFILPDMAYDGHQDQVDRRYTFEPTTGDAYFFCSGGEWDVSINGFLLSVP